MSASSREIKSEEDRDLYVEVFEKVNAANKDKSLPTLKKIEKKGKKGDKGANEVLRLINLKDGKLRLSHEMEARIRRLRKAANSLENENPLKQGWFNYEAQLKKRIEESLQAVMANDYMTSTVLTLTKDDYKKEDQKREAELRNTKEALEQWEKNLADPLAAISAKQVAEWEEKINIYDIKGEDGVIETPAISREKVKNTLGDNTKILYHGIKNPDALETTARKKFIEKLAEILNNGEKYSYVGNEKDEPRKIDPDKSAISLRKLLGDDGEKLYKAALKEEYESRAFRDAVFRESTKHYPGPEWDERLIQWIGGPSAAGKSKATDLFVEEAGKRLKYKKDNPNGGNTVVTIDGGVERAVSQMRQYVVEVALQKGYPGVRDVDKFSSLKSMGRGRIRKLKGKVEKAVVATKNLSMAIPATFTNPRTKSKIAEYKKLENTKQFFGEVQADKETTARNGLTRAWNQNFDSEHTTNRKIRTNNRNIGCESKKYSPKHFDAGVRGTKRARKEYLDTYGKDSVWMVLESDFIHVRKNNEGSWVRCKKEDPGPTVVLSIRDFSAWEAYLKYGNNPNHKLDEHLDLPTWLEDSKKLKLLAPPLLSFPKAEPVKEEEEEDDDDDVTFQPPNPLNRTGKRDEAKEESALTFYAHPTTIGVPHLVGSVESSGKLARIFDSPKPEEVSSDFKEWAKKLFEDNDLTETEAKKIKNPLLLNEKNIGLLEKHPFFMPHIQSPLAKDCFIYKTDTLPTVDSLYFLNFSETAAYLRYQNRLFYANRAKNELIEIPIKPQKLVELDAAVNPKVGEKLSEKNLSDIYKITGHQHKAEETYINPVVDNTGQFAQWLKDLIPPDLYKLLLNLLKEIYSKAQAVTFDSTQQLQPWLTTVIEKTIKDPNSGQQVRLKYDALIKKHTEPEVQAQLALAVNAALREALRVCIPFEKNTSEYRTIETITSFLDFLVSHQYKYLSNLNEMLLREKNMRQPQPETELLLERQIATLRKAKTALAADPLMNIDSLIEDTQKLIKDCTKKREQFSTQNSITEESSQISPLTPAASSSTSFFHQAADRIAHLATRLSNTPPEGKPYRRELTFKRADNEKIKVTLEERFAENGTGPVSDITKLDAKLDTTAILAKVACNFKNILGKSLDLFPGGEETARVFMKTLIHFSRNRYHRMGADVIESFLKTHNAALPLQTKLTESEQARLVKTLFEAYRNATEQLDPYSYTEDPKSNMPYQDVYFPSDVFIRLAKNHVDSFVARCGSGTPVAIGIDPDCWDPHYVEAVALYCHIKGYPPPEYGSKERSWKIDLAGQGSEEPGWKIDLSVGKKNAFKDFYETRFGALDAKKGIDYKIAEHKPADPDMAEAKHLST